MKKLSFVFILSLLFTSLTVTAQYGYDDEFYGDNNTYPGYLGDNFSLEGALEIFKESRDLQDFEHRLNRDEFFVNNLDLNNDGRTDFVRVQDVSEDRNYRLLALQAVLGRRDIQDVAVIAIEKTGRREATLQIVGDEYLFGPNMVVEPNDIAYNSDRRRGYGPSGADVEFRRLFVNVYYWPTVRSLFRPRYSFYRSPWSWGYYPDFYRPWRPWAYSYYYDRCGLYRRPFWRVAPAVRIVYVNNYYFPRRRTYVPYVRNRYNDCVVYYDRDRGGRNDGPRRRDITQTVPDRRRDFDKHRGTKYQFRDRREGETIGKRRNDNIVRSEKGTKGTRGTIGSAGVPNHSVKKSERTKSDFGTYKPAPNRSDKLNDRKPVRKSYDKPSRSIDTPSKSYDKPSKSYDKPSKSYDRPSKSNDRPSKSYDTPKRSKSYDKPSRSSSKPSKSYDRPKRSSKSSSSSSKPSRSNKSSKSNRGGSSFKSSSSSSKSSSRSVAKPSKSYKSSKSTSSSKRSTSKSRSSKKGF